MVVHHDLRSQGRVLKRSLLRGSTASGHYVAYVRDSRNWFHMDDELTQQVQWSEVEEQHACMLFYMAETPLDMAESVPISEEKGGPEAPELNGSPKAGSKTESSLSEVLSGGGRECEGLRDLIFGQVSQKKTWRRGNWLKMQGTEETSRKKSLDFRHRGFPWAERSRVQRRAQLLRNLYDPMLFAFSIPS